jgi:hypothetical protein
MNECDHFALAAPISPYLRVYTFCKYGAHSNVWRLQVRMDLESLLIDQTI